MSANIHKGTELNNVRETWERNEQQSRNAEAPANKSGSLERRIQKEAEEYEKANKEERLLGGERASEKDPGNTSGS